MTKKDKIDEEALLYLVNELRNGFLAELTLLKSVCNLKLNGREGEVIIILASACSTGTAVYQLGKSPNYFYSEMMMLSRSFIEKMTNYCYLQVCDDIEYKKFLLHPFYKIFHNTNQSKYTSKSRMGIEYTGREEIKNNHNVLEALKLFSDIDGRKNWSSLGIDKKISFIAEKTKIDTGFFLFNTLTIYSNASEALHGSLYGCALSTGAYTLGVDHSNKNAVHDNLFKNVALIYSQLSSLIDEIIKYLSENNEMKKISVASRKNQESVLNIMQAIFKIADKNE